MKDKYLGEKLEDIYKQKLFYAQKRIQDLVNTGTTYHVKSSNDSMVWEVISDWIVLKELPKRHSEFLGIKDVEIREQIKDYVLPLADFLLELMFKCG